MSADPLAWMESAHCAHPLWRDLDIPAQRAICAGCPVSAQCLDLGRQVLADADRASRKDLIVTLDLWGGLTLREIDAQRPESQETDDER